MHTLSPSADCLCWPLALCPQPPISKTPPISSFFPGAPPPPLCMSTLKPCMDVTEGEGHTLQRGWFNCTKDGYYYGFAKKKKKVILNSSEDPSPRFKCPVFIKQRPCPCCVLSLNEDTNERFDVCSVAFSSRRFPFSTNHIPLLSSLAQLWAPLSDKAQGWCHFSLWSFCDIHLCKDHNKDIHPSIFFHLVPFGAADNKDILLLIHNKDRESYSILSKRQI